MNGLEIGAAADDLAIMAAGFLEQDWKGFADLRGVEGDLLFVELGV